MADYGGKTNDELREELEARGLKVSGTKDELVARLEADDASDGEDSSVMQIMDDDEPEDDLEIVAVDDEGDEYIEAPPGGLFGTDGLTNFQRTVNPSREPRADGLVGVDEDYPAQASRSAPDDSDD